MNVVMYFFVHVIWPRLGGVSWFWIGQVFFPGLLVLKRRLLWVGCFARFSWRV